MLSKSKGQTLRVAAALHIFFQDKAREDGSIQVKGVSTILSDEAILAAKNYVETCCQHAAYIRGRGTIEDEIKALSAGKYFLISYGKARVNIILVYRSQCFIYIIS